MAKYVRSGGAWVEVGLQVVGPGGVAIHRDFAEPILCHADGQMHSSRSTYDAAVRSAGMVEVGKTEMRKLQSGPAYRGGGIESPRATIRRLLDAS